jgi:hypothetical protein
MPLGLTLGWRAGLFGSEDNDYECLVVAADAFVWQVSKHDNFDREFSGPRITLPKARSQKPGISGFLSGQIFAGFVWNSPSLAPNFFLSGHPDLAS